MIVVEIHTSHVIETYTHPSREPLAAFEPV